MLFNENNTDQNQMPRSVPSGSALFVEIHTGNTGHITQNNNNVWFFFIVI